MIYKSPTFGITVLTLWMMKCKESESVEVRKQVSKKLYKVQSSKATAYFKTTLLIKWRAT